MQNLASLAIDLLCAITFPPESGNDPEDMADLERTSWQTLIHSLTPVELEAVRATVRENIVHLQSKPIGALPRHLQSKLSVLQQFLDGKLH